MGVAALGVWVCVRVKHRVDVKLTAFASAILAAVQFFFLLLINSPPIRLR